MSRKASTIKDIARALDLNISTVSRALSNNKLISDDTRKKVLDYAKKINYRPNALASSLRTGKGNTIGLIVPNINRHFFSNLIYGVENVLGPAGYNIIICQSNELLNKEKQAINTLINARVDGIIISISKETKNAKHFEPIMDRDIPFIQVDRVLENLNTHKIVNNNFKASFTAVNHLIEKGYKKIAHLAGPQFINIYNDRLNGYCEAIKSSSLKSKSLLIYENMLTYEQGYELATELFSKKNPPDAFFASSDFAALGVLQALKNLKINVPQKVGVVGYANEPFTELISPSITTLDQFSMDMGKEAAKIILYELKNPNENNNIAKQIIIEPQLIIRESSSRSM
jgi:LacI family repressor for deo operon, udp, cdd, tsx, nupC, and nupG